MRRTPTLNIKPRSALLTAFLWVPLAVSRADYPLEIIELNARPAEEVIPLLAPFAGPGGSVSGSGANLFVRTSPDRMADIRRMLQTLDSPPRNLLIQVRGIAGSTGAGTGLDGNDARSGRDARDRTSTHEVRTLDGRRAYIATGSEQPAEYREIRPGPGGAYRRGGTAYHRSESGFYVTPRVVGERVTIEINSFDSDSRPGGQATATASLNTVVTGSIGDWIALGGNDTDSHRRTYRLDGMREEGRSRGRSIQIRVLELP